MQLLGIDIGTTSVCAVAMDASSGEVLRSRTVNSDAFIPGSFDWEKLQSAQKLLGIGRQLADELITAQTGGKIDPLSVNNPYIFIITQQNCLRSVDYAL